MKTKREFLMTESGKVYRAKDARELVRMMHRDNYEQMASDDAFMLMVAKRVLDMHGLTLNTETPEDFVASMKVAGLVDEDEAKE